MTIASRLKLNLGLSTAIVLMMVAAFGAALILENRIREQSLFADQLMRGVFDLSLLTDYYVRHPEARPKEQWWLKHASLLQLLKKNRHEEEDEKGWLKPINQSLSDLEALFKELTETYASGHTDEPLVRQKREQLADLNIMRSRAIAETATRLTADSRAAMAAVTRQIAVVFPVLSLLVLVLTVWSATHIRNSIAGPIEQLRQGAAILGTGQLDYCISLGSADEFGQLAGEFNRMAQRLKMITASRDKLSQEVAERQRAEAALEKAAEQQRLAMEAAELGAWDYRFDTDEVIWDARCQALWGISNSDRIDSATAISGIHADDRAAIEEALKQALAGANAGAYHPEFRVVWPDGSVHWVVSYGRVYFAGEGDQRHPVRFIGVNRDITQEKQAAEMIRESQRQNEFLASVLEYASQPFAVGYPDGRLGLANRAFEQLTGYHGDELRAINWVETLTPPQWRAFEQQKLEELHRSGQPVRYEKEYLRKDGTRVPIELLVHLATAADGSPAYYYSFLTDVTERKRAEAALRLSEERLASILNSLLDGVVTVDEQQHITLFNPAAERLFGCRTADMLGQPLDRLIPERFRATHIAHIRAFGQSNVTRRKMGELLAVAGLHTDGTEFPIEAAISQTEVAGQKLFTVILRDITERKQAEAALTKRTEELTRSNQDLEQFAYVASHDLQEPLRAVAGCVQLLQKRYQGQLDERADEFITHAVEGAKRMRHLIDDLLAFSRVGTRGQPLQPVDSGAALTAALANLTAAIHDSGAVITYDPLPTVNADPTQLTLLLQNLISNAIKFRREVPPRIHVGAQHQDHSWVLSVRDNGIGIEPQYFERIFGIFQRLHTRREYAGTGIGLAICKKIVERHGGRLWVESVPGAGSTFYCCLPDGQ